MTTQKADKDWKEVTIEFIHFTNAGETVDGELVDKTELEIKGETVGKYTVKRSDGQSVAFLGGVQIDPIMSDIDIGTQVKLEYTGREKTTGGNEVKTFRVFTK